MRKLLAVTACVLALALAAATPGSAAIHHRVHFVALAMNPPGPDHPITNQKLNEEYVTIENDALSVRHLGGWTLRDAAGHVYTFHHLRLGPGHRVTVHTGSGTDTHRDRYWGSANYVWNNDHDSAQLVNRGQVVVTMFQY